VFPGAIARWPAGQWHLSCNCTKTRSCEHSSRTRKIRLLCRGIRDAVLYLRFWFRSNRAGSKFCECLGRTFAGFHDSSPRRRQNLGRRVHFRLRSGVKEVWRCTGIGMILKLSFNYTVEGLSLAVANKSLGKEPINKDTGYLFAGIRHDRGSERQQAMFTGNRRLFSSLSQALQTKQARKSFSQYKMVTFGRLAGFGAIGY
jgi:hypothetical protein